jgi:ribosomal protein S27E
VPERGTIQFYFCHYTTLFCPNAAVFEFPEGASISVGQDQTEDTRAHIRRLAEAADATISEDREANGTREIKVTFPHDTAEAMFKTGRCLKPTRTNV